MSGMEEMRAASRDWLVRRVFSFERRLFIFYFLPKPVSCGPMASKIILLLSI